MKQSLLIAGLVSLVLLVGCTPAGPQTSAPPSAAISAPGDTEQAITQLERDWVAAIVKKDTATIDRLLADDFSGATDDQRYSKADAIEDVKTGTHESLDLDNIRVRVFGDTALATMGQTEKSHHGKEDFSGHYLFTNVWLKRNGEWRVVASHGSRAR
jgi:ketosteroid isomerase-like protein